MDEENLVPLYYEVRRDLNDAQIAEVVHALQITPVAAAIIANAHDCELASKLSDNVIRVSSLPDAHERAVKYGEPTVIVTGEIQLNAHYADGRTEEIEVGCGSDGGS